MFKKVLLFCGVAAFAVSLSGVALAQGKLTGAVAAPPKSVNLTREGTADWAHWGHGDGNSFAYKATGKGQISNLTPLGAFHPAPYKDNAVAFSWTDSGSVGVMGKTTTGVYTESFAPGLGFALHAPADTTLRTLKVYVGGAFAAGTFIAHLSDGSAPDYVSTEISAAHNFYAVFTLVYRAAKEGQSLQISWINTRSLGKLSNVTLQAATLIEGTENSRFVPDALREAFVMTLAAGRNGAVWVGTEGAGLWRYNPAAAPSSAWRQFTTADGLGDNAIYSVACDKQGRIWAGHLNHGVSVYNGKQWKNYDALTGPLGERVFKIAVCPTDGDVWMASSRGLARYSVKRKTWTYITRADGLPSDQANALAFDKAGNLYVGTQCDGIAKAYAADEYLNWHTTPGIARLPMTPTGEGLPSGLINDVLVARDGAVYAATASGLAVSKDGGDHWTYRRGRDWREKAQYQAAAFAASPVSVKETPEDSALPAEDAIMCLAQDAAGRIYLGHWRKGEEILPASDAKHSETNRPERGASGDWVTALLPLSGGAMWSGHYRTDGLTACALPKVSAEETETAALPLPAAPPPPAELAAWTEKAKTSAVPLSTGGGAYLGEDWTTGGDWTGRYGRGSGILCAMHSPFDGRCVNETEYDVKQQIGPLRSKDDGLRYWIHWIKSDNPHVLYDPDSGYRRQADWDDHGEAYPFTQEGPDIWITITVPAGTHRVSLYLFNRSAHGEWIPDDCYRDYLVELREFRPNLQEADALPALARTRAQNTWGGVYKQFAVQGAGKFYLKIARNHSINAICSGVFLDHLPAKIGAADYLSSLSEVTYAPPLNGAVDVPPPVAGKGLTGLQAASSLWTALDASAAQRKTAESLTVCRLLAYRAALAGAANPALLENWRWQICLWTPDDRQRFAAVMAQAWQILGIRYPAIKKGAEDALKK